MRSKTLVGAIAFIAVAACASPEMDAKKGAEICKQAGLSEDSPVFADCVGTQVAKLEERRAEFGQALAVGMQAYGDGARQYSAPRPTYYSPPIYTPPQRLQTNCTSMQTQPGMVFTNCY